MILNVKNKKPFISFEKGTIKKDVQARELFKIILNNNYNENYRLNLVIDNSISVSQLTTYIFECSGDVAGVFDVFLEITTDKGFILKSNKITINVIQNGKNNNF